jgi:hypothetical protein
MSWEAPSARQTGDLITAAIWNQDVVGNVAYLHNNLAQHGLRWGMDFIWTGDTPVWGVDSAQPFCQYTSLLETNGAYGEAAFVLEEGTYDVELLVETSTNHCKVDLTLDGTVIATGIDMYSASLTRNVVKTTSGVTVTGSGRHLLRVTINGHNASSNAYVLYLTCVRFIPSAVDQGVD